MEAVLIS